MNTLKSSLLAAFRPAFVAFALGALLKFTPAAVHADADFTIELSTPLGSRVLAVPEKPWRLFKGITEPNVGWETTDESFLGADWQTKSGGFGYGYSNVPTQLGDMKDNYSTVYIRQSFSVGEVIDPRRLKLQIDYDDGFVAFLDGREIARANAPGPSGQWPPHNSLATAAHTASAAAGGGPPENYLSEPSAPPLFVREEDGPPLVHILAIQGLNRSLSDGGFSLIPTLLAEDLFPITSEGSIQLSGKAALPGTARVTVDGAPASYNSSDKTWSMAQVLKPGMNRMIMQALDGGNSVLASLTNDVVSKPSSTLASGLLTKDTTWDAGMGAIEVTGNVQVAAGVTLTIGAGTTVIFGPDGSVRTSGGTINVAGTSSAPVFLLPSDGRTPWQEIAATGPGSSITLRFAEIVAGGLHVTNGVTMLIEDSVVRDFSYDRNSIEQYLVYALGSCDITMTRSRFLRYYTMAFGGQSALHIEDCIFDDAEHDFLKPQETPMGSFIRRCLFQHSTVVGTDGIDTGVDARLVVESCIFHDIPDKAISVEASELTITNCLIYNVGIGVAVKDDSTVTLVNNTIANSKYGLAVYLKNPGAHFAAAFATNNIVSANNTNVTLRNPDTGKASPNVSITIDHSDIGGPSVYPGTSNLNKDPLFLDAASGDFRLQTGSPAIGTGLGGQDMGVAFPVGPSVPNLRLTLTEQPLSQSAAAASSVNLRVAATGTPPLSYQWQLNGLSLAGETNASLFIGSFDASQEGSYQVEVTDATGSLSSIPALVLLNAPVRLSYRRPANDRLDLRLIGTAGANFSLESSSDLMNWLPILSNAVPNGILEFHDTITNVNRFYRFRLIP